MKYSSSATRLCSKFNVFFFKFWLKKPAASPLLPNCFLVRLGHPFLFYSNQKQNWLLCCLGPLRKHDQNSTYRHSLPTEGQIMNLSCTSKAFQVIYAKMNAFMTCLRSILVWQFYPFRFIITPCLCAVCCKTQGLVTSGLLELEQWHREEDQTNPGMGPAYVLTPALIRTPCLLGFS